MIEYFDERPDMHHEIGALDYMRFTGAPYLASIHSKLKSHKDNERVHITDEERDKWNHKVDKTTFYELENKVLTKAEKKEIPLRLSQLQNDVPYLTSADINIKLNSENYITKGDLDSKGYITSNDLSRYATKDYVDNRGYLTQSALANYVTQAQFTAAMAAITPSGGSSPVDLSNYYTKSYIDNEFAKYYTSAQVDSAIDAAIGNIVIDGDEDVTQSVVESWVRSWTNRVYNSEVTNLANAAIEAFKNGDLQTEAWNIAGRVVDNRVDVAGLHLASGVASLLVEKGIVDDTDPDNPDLISAGIVIAINGDNDTTATKIKSDYIDLDGTTVARKIEAEDMNLTGNIVAHNLTIVNSGDDSVTGGNGTFVGTVQASEYKTISGVDKDKMFTGATEDVVINGTTLMFVNGLFVGSSTTGGSSDDVTTGTIHVLTGTSEGFPINPIVIEYQYKNSDEWVTTIDHTRPIDVIRFTFTNTSNRTIYTDIYRADGNNGFTHVVINPGTTQYTYGWQTGTAQSNWSNNTSDGVLTRFTVNKSSTDGFYYYK